MHRFELELMSNTEKLTTANRLAFEWLAKYGLHPPTCERTKARIVPNGAYVSGLGKDYGGRYATEEELARVRCTCGLEEVHSALCQASES
ncbi:hypothetical protein LCGC14_1543430 [marine sediment metagenome]|uniref:Uncharacterized protein n=1 Tax=marine sediment metagenome TaxID=412755 RepID=A0A0F9L8I9_9ZZZZ